MRIFVSWNDSTTQQFAEALCARLPNALPSATPVATHERLNDYYAYRVGDGAGRFASAEERKLVKAQRGCSIKRELSSSSLRIRSTAEASSSSSFFRLSAATPLFPRASRIQSRFAIVCRSSTAIAATRLASFSGNAGIAVRPRSAISSAVPSPMRVAPERISLPNLAIAPMDEKLGVRPARQILA
jgi:hypothetical protein